MARCGRCWLHKSIRVVNLLTFLLAIGMIMYSLWLQKRWSVGVAQIPITANLPKPWMDWQKLIAQFIDKDHLEFKIFLDFQLKMCQLLTIVILLPQISVLVLAITLWVTGTEPRRHRSDSEPTSIIQSFLVRPNLPVPVPDSSRHTCCSCENLLQGNPQESHC